MPVFYFTKNCVQMEYQWNHVLYTSTHKIITEHNNTKKKKLDSYKKYMSWYNKIYFRTLQNYLVLYILSILIFILLKLT